MNRELLVKELNKAEEELKQYTNLKDIVLADNPNLILEMQDIKSKVETLRVKVGQVVPAKEDKFYVKRYSIQEFNRLGYKELKNGLKEFKEQMEKLFAVQPNPHIRTNITILMQNIKKAQTVLAEKEYQIFLYSM